MPLRLPEKSRNVITEKQRKFVECITNSKSDTYCDVIKSCNQAGYSGKGNPIQRAVKVLASKTVLNLLMNHSQNLQFCETIREEMTRERFQQELYIFLQSCKDAEDRTNWKGALELFGKFQQFLTERHLVTVEQAEKMSAQQMAELRELSKLRLLGNGPITDATLNAPRLIESDDNSGPVETDGIDSTLLQCPSMPFTEKEGIQDVAGDDDNAYHNCSDIDKCSNDKDLTNQ
jgi:hypothetical protein